MAIVEVSESELRAYRTELRNTIFRQLHRQLRQAKLEGRTQADMAATIGMDQAQLSRLLKGENGLNLETLADLARALDCRIVTSLEPLQQPARRGTVIYAISSQQPPARTAVTGQAANVKAPSANFNKQSNELA